MNKIEVAVLHEGHNNPTGMMMFLAMLTQRNHVIKNMDDLKELYDKCIGKTNWKMAADIAKLPHGTIKRTSPVTIAIVGASRRFLAQARTHTVGLTFVSGSLQYSDHSVNGDSTVQYDRFCIPYEVLVGNPVMKQTYLNKCVKDLDDYTDWVAMGYSNDTAGYLMNHALRNILIIHGNQEAIDNFINKRICRRNTDETRYVAALIWKKMYESTDGDIFFKTAGADCVQRSGCREGHMCCGKPYKRGMTPDEFIDNEWPELGGLK